MTAQESDPEVKKKEIDKEIEEMKIEMQNEKYETIFDGLENVTQSATNGLVDAAFDKLGGGGSDEVDDDRAPKPVEREVEKISEKAKEAADPNKPDPLGDNDGAGMIEDHETSSFQDEDYDMEETLAELDETFEQYDDQIDELEAEGGD